MQWLISGQVSLLRDYIILDTFINCSEHVPAKCRRLYVKCERALECPSWVPMLQMKTLWPAEAQQFAPNHPAQHVLVMCQEQILGLPVTHPGPASPSPSSGLCGTFWPPRGLHVLLVARVRWRSIGCLMFFHPNSNTSRIWLPVLKSGDNVVWPQLSTWK